MWQGMDGLRGPGLSGSGNYLSRSALLFGSPNQKGTYGLNIILWLKYIFLLYVKYFFLVYYLKIIFLIYDIFNFYF